MVTLDGTPTGHVVPLGDRLEVVGGDLTLVPEVGFEEREKPSRVAANEFLRDRRGIAAVASSISGGEQVAVQKRRRIVVGAEERADQIGLELAARLVLK